MLITHGGGCGASYAPAEPPLDDASGTLDAVPGIGQSYVEALARGFAVMSTALANTGHNCNVAHNAESLMMAKERLIERYGRPAVRHRHRLLAAVRSPSTPSPTPTPASTRAW